jgi:hypothetical protein
MERAYLPAITAQGRKGSKIQYYTWCFLHPIPVHETSSLYQLKVYMSGPQRLFLTLYTLISLGIMFQQDAFMIRGTDLGINALMFSVLVSSFKVNLLLVFSFLGGR